MPLATGQVLKDRYRIVRLLGQGGMGAVYKAWDLNMERPRALKENLDTSPEAQRQFKREAQILGDLTHPNLTKVIDHFTIPGQGQYLVMEFVEGEDLGEMLARLSGPLPLAQALGWIEQTCAALAYLHAQNPPVIHRDVKPANIKVTPQGKTLLVDFGIAKVFDPQASTTMGAKAVTPGYSPMEQYGSGQHTGPATDVYALGATLYALLSGQAPPAAPDRNLGATLPSLQDLNPAVSPGLEAAVLKALAMQPQDRFGSAIELAAALRPSPIPALQSKLPPVHLAPSITPRAVPGAPYSAVAWQRLPRSSWILLAALILGIVYLLIANASGWWPFASITSEAPTTVTKTTTAPLAVLQPTLTVAAPTEAFQMATAAVHTADALLQTRAVTPATVTPTIAPSTALPVTKTPRPDQPPINAILGYTWTRPADTMRMVFIPTGEFLMGSKQGESGAYDDEYPQHMVYLDAYWIDQIEVTNAQYSLCVMAGDCQRPSSTKSATRNSYYGNAKFANYPVIYVSWDDAQAYCAWAGGRLPSEAEWEKAARGTEGRIYPWGNQTPNCNLANYIRCASDISPAGSLPGGASPYGLFDMAGNVYEWVADWYSETYYASSPASNPIGPPSGQTRVMRGGAWNYASRVVRVANRGGGVPVNRLSGVGFRCSR